MLETRGAGNPACSRLSGGSFDGRRLKAGGSQNWLPDSDFLNKSA